MALSTDFKDDVLDGSVNEKRKYKMITNDDGTVSFEDVTVYSQTGSSFGADEVNEEREAINSANQSIGDEDISDIGDGTVTGAIVELNDTFTTRMGGLGFYGGTMTLQLSGQTSLGVISLDSINNAFGVNDSTNNNTAIFFVNGDGAANTVKVDGSYYRDNYWYVTFASAATGSCRINYLVVRRGLS